MEHVSAGKVAMSLLLTPLIIPFAGAAFFAIVFYHALVVESIGTSWRMAGLGIFAALILAMVTS